MNTPETTTEASQVKALHKAMQVITQVADKRQRIPILNHVLIESNGHLRLTATDLEVGIRVTMPPLSEETDFQVTVPAKVFRDVLSTAVGDIDLAYTPGEPGQNGPRYYSAGTPETLVIHDATAEWQLYGGSAQDYPVWPDVFSFALDSYSTAECVKALNDAINRCKPGSWERNYAMVEVGPFGTIKWSTAKSLASILNKLKKTHPTFDLEFVDNHIYISMGDTEIVLRGEVS